MQMAMPDPKSFTREVLISSLKANNLPASGNKQELYDRLVSGKERQKPGPKPGSKRVVQPKQVPNKQKTTAQQGTPADAAEKAFFAEEHQRLIDAGMTDTKEIQKEVMRRWNVHKKSKTSASSPQVVRESTLLDKGQLAARNLKLQSIDSSSGKPVYLYVPTKSAAAKPSTAKPMQTAPKPSPLKQAREDEEDEDDEDDDEDDEAEDDDEENISWASQVCTNRMMEKLTKDTLVTIAKECGANHSGSKKQLADICTEQLLNETDDENDE